MLYFPRAIVGAIVVGAISALALSHVIRLMDEPAVETTFSMVLAAGPDVLDLAHAWWLLILGSCTLRRIRSVPSRKEHAVRELSDTIDIDAPIERVWLIITNFAAYPQWNRMMQNIRGEVIVGACLESDVRMFGRHTLKGKVLVAQPEREFHWSGHLVAPWLLKARHRITLERLDDDRTRCTLGTRLTGVLVFFSGHEWRQAQESSRLTHAALKIRAEAGARARELA